MKENLKPALKEVFEYVLKEGELPPGLFWKRVAKSHGLEVSTLKQFSRKVSAELSRQAIKGDTDLNEVIEEILDDRTRYEKALEKIKKRKDLPNRFQTMLIGSEHELDEEELSCLWKEVESIKKKRNIDKSKRQTKVQRMRKAKEELREAFLKNPNLVTKQRLSRISEKYRLDFKKVKRLFNEKRRKWIQERREAETIDDIL